MFPFVKNLFTVISYAAVFIALQYFLYKFGLVSNFPNSENLLHWDAVWYKSIVENGYMYKATWQSNSGFYFLFPALWKVLHVGVIGICCINLLLFAIGFSMLTTLYPLKFREKLLWLSIPVIFYVLVPYSEALFFLLAVLTMWGIRHNNRWVSWIALFLLSLTRATTIMLMPAFLVMELLGNERKEWKRSVAVYVVYYLSALLVGLTTFVLIQYWQTGVWFAYFKQQANHWGHKFNQPEFPLQNLSNPNLLGLGALAVFSCILASITLVKCAQRWIAFSEKHEKIKLLSLCYLLMTLLLLLFANVPTEVTGGFRYAMLSPFFFALLFNYTHNIKYQSKDYLIAFVFANIVWLLFSYKNLEIGLHLNINTVIIALFMQSANAKRVWPVFVLIALGFLSQIILYQEFLKGSIIVD